MSVKELFRLDGRIALITGGSRGLGLQMAQALGEMGCRLILTARKVDELDASRKQLEATGCEVMTIAGDLQQKAFIPELVSRSLDRFTSIDILVNNAGATWGAPAEEYPDDGWNKVLNLNVNVPFFLSREVGRRSMIPRQQGKIINIASVAGLKGTAPGVHTIAYNTSKAAMINFTRTLAAEWGRFNINVNAICPGFFPSKMSAGLLEQVQESVIARAPLHRIGGEEDLKGAVVFLASDAARHITGQYLAVDGGSSIV